MVFPPFHSCPSCHGFTRSGHTLVHMEASYGCAVRKEPSRQRQKRKVDSSRTLSQHGVGRSTCTMPQRTTKSQIEPEEELATPPSASTRLATTPPPRSERHLRGRLPTCSDFGLARHFAFLGQGFCSATLAICWTPSFQIAVKTCLVCPQGLLVPQVTTRFRIRPHFAANPVG